MKWIAIHQENSLPPIDRASDDPLRYILQCFDDNARGQSEVFHVTAEEMRETCQGYDRAQWLDESSDKEMAKEIFEAGRTIIDYDPMEVIHNVEFKYKNFEDYWLDESESIPSVTNEEDELWNTVVAKIAAYDIMSKTRPGNTKQIEEWKQKAIMELKASYTISRKPSSSSLHS